MNEDSMPCDGEADKDLTDVQINGQYFTNP